MKFVIVIPTYNEKENVENLINSIEKLSKKIKGGVELKILVVDDDSPDGTGKIVDRLTKVYNNVYINHKKGKKGLGFAYINGFKYALDNLNADYVLTMDCDFSHNPKYIPQFIKELGKFDVLIGSRYIKGGGTYNWPLYRRIISSGANLLAKTVLRLKNNDCTSGFRCYSKNALNKIDFENIKSGGYSFLLEILYRCQRKKLKIREIPFVFIDRTLGETKISKKEILRTLYTLIKLKIERYK